MDNCRIVVGNVNCRFESRIPAILSQNIRDELSYEVEGQQFARRRFGHWDGRRSIYNGVSRTFPTGCYSRVIPLICQYGLNPEIISPKKLERVQLVLPRKNPLLRPYQQPVVDVILREKRGVVKSPTGSGKSIICYEAILQRGWYPALLICYSTLVFYDHQQRLKDLYGIDAGLWGDGKHEESPHVNIAIINTLYEAVRQRKSDEGPCQYGDQIRSFLSKIQQVHVDEIQHIPAETSGIVLQHIDTPVRVGYSATPWRDDHMDIVMEGITGPKICEIKTKDLVEQGWLAKPTIYAVKINKTQLKGIVYGKRETKKLNTKSDWQTQNRLWVVENEFRNQLAVQYALAMGKRTKTPVLLCVNYIDHGEIIENLLKQQVQNPEEVRFIHSRNLPKSEYGIFKKQVENGEIKYIVASPIVDEGVDIPSIQSLVLLGGSRSTVRAIQRIGRGLRITPSKKELFVFDFQDEAKWFRASANSRIRMYEYEGHSVIVVNPKDPNQLQERYSKPLEKVEWEDV